MKQTEKETTPEENPAPTDYYPLGAALQGLVELANENTEELAAIGREWRKDSSLEKWFPFTADELAVLKAENENLRAELALLLNPPIQVENVKSYRCETCQEEATVHIEIIGMHFCQSCIKKIDARIKEINGSVA